LLASERGRCAAVEGGTADAEAVSSGSDAAFTSTGAGRASSDAMDGAVEAEAGPAMDGVARLATR